MHLEHGSYGYPSEIVPLLDLLFLLLGAVLFAFWPPRLGGSRSPSAGVSTAGAFVAGAGGLALTFWLLGPPVPQIPDEVSYLFAAETFAEGRLTNPPHPLGRRGAYQHVLDEPTRQSKYPPGQAAVLALGLVLGHPAIGLVLSAGLLVAVTVWALLRFVEPPWAHFGGLFVLARIGVGGYWNQTYWGGSLAAVSAWLAFAALGRWRSELGRGAVLALGLVGLAATRPIEGAALAAVIGPAFLGRSLSRRGDPPAERPWRARLAAPVAAAVVGSLGLAVLLGYNRAVTGSWWLHPHLAYSAREMTGFQHFVWEAAPARGWAGVWELLERPLLRASYLAFFVLGIGGSAVAAWAAVVFWRSPPSQTRRLGRLCVLALAAVLAALALIRPFHVHYGAPAVAPLVLLLVLGLAQLQTSGRWPVLMRGLPAALLAGSALLCLAQLPAQRPEPEHWAVRRAAIEKKLETEPGRQLVLVDDRAGQPQSWSFPVPDPTTAKVVWVDLDGSEPESIAAALGERTVWILELGRDEQTLRRLAP